MKIPSSTLMGLAQSIFQDLVLDIDAPNSSQPDEVRRFNQEEEAAAMRALSHARVFCIAAGKVLDSYDGKVTPPGTPRAITLNHPHAPHQVEIEKELDPEAQEEELTPETPPPAPKEPVNPKRIKTGR